MERKIISSKRFLKKLNNLLIYLESNWSKKVANEFSLKLEARAEKICKYPEIGMPSKKLGVRSFKVGKHNRVYYSFNSVNIKLLLIRDTRMNPQKTPY